MLPVAIDWTHHEKRSAWQVLVASIPLPGRAIPIAWQTFPKGCFGGEERQAERKRTAAEADFLVRLRQRLPRERPIVLLMDRGFASEAMLLLLEELGFSYIVRIGTQARVHTAAYGPDTLRAMVFKGKRLLAFHDARYKGRLRLKQLVVAYGPARQGRPKAGWSRRRPKRPPSRSVRPSGMMRELRQRGYKGGMTILREFVHPLRPVRRIWATERFETGSGEQAQVDWAFWGRKRMEGV